MNKLICGHFLVLDINPVFELVFVSYLFKFISKDAKH